MGRTVVITGASAGVGRACAETFARDDWQVGLLARGADGLEGARDAVERLGGRALVVPADVLTRSRSRRQPLAWRRSLDRLRPGWTRQ